MKKFVRLSVIVLALVAIVIALLHTGSSKRFVLSEVRTALQRQGIDFTAAGIDYNLLSLRVTFSNVVVRSIALSAAPPFLQADRISVDAGLLDLFRGRYRIESAEADAVRIHVVIDESGSANLPQQASATPSTPAKPVNWFVDSLHVLSGSITFEDRANRVDIRIPNWQAAIRGRTDGTSQTLEWNLVGPAEMRFAHGTIPVDSSHIALSLNMVTGTIDLTDARLVSGTSNIRAKGSLGTLGDPVLDLVADARVSPSDFDSLLHLSPDFYGEWTAGGKLHGRPGNLQFDIDGFRMDSALGSITGAGALAIESPGESRLNVEFQSIDLAKLGRTVEAPVALAGSANGSLTLSWPALDARRLSGGGRVEFRNSRPGAAAIGPGGALTITAQEGDLAIATDSLVINGAGIRGDLRLSATKQLTGRFRIAATDAGSLWNSIPVAGPIDADLRLGGALDRPEVSVELHAPALSYGSFEDLQFNAAAILNPDTIRVENVSVGWRDLSAEATGFILLKGTNPTVNMTINLPESALDGWLAGIGRPDIPVSGRTSASAVLSGTLTNPAVRLQFQARELRAFDELLGTLSIQAQLDRDALKIESLLLEKQQGSFRAAGSVGFGSGQYDIKMEGSDFPIEHLALQPNNPVRGTLAVSGAASGTMDAPGASIRLGITDLQVKDQALGDVRLEVELADRKVHASLESPQLGTTLRGSIGIDRPYASTMEIEAKDVELSTFPFQPYADLSGKVTVHTAAGGDLQDWRTLRARTILDPLDLHWRNERLQSDGPIEADVADGSVFIRNLSLRIAESVARISGSFPLVSTAAEGNIRIHVDAGVAHIRDVIAAQTKDLSLPQASGRLTIDGSVRGYSNAINPEATIRLDGVAVDAEGLPAPFKDIELAASLQDGILRLDRLRGQWAAASIEAAGSLPLGMLSSSVPFPSAHSMQPAQISADVRNFTLSSLPDAPAGIDGVFSLHFKAEAASSDLKAVKGTITFSELRLRAENYEIHQDGISSIDIRDGVVSVGHLELAGPETHLKIAGSAGTTEPMTAILTLDGLADASVLSLFARDLQISGKTTVRLSAEGSLPALRVNGFVEMADGQARLAEPPVIADGVLARIEFSDNELRLARLEGVLNGGTLKGSGSAKLLESGFRADAKVESRGFYFEFPDGVRTISNASLAIAGDAKALAVSGSVDILQGSYNEPLSIERGVIQYFSNPPPPVPTELSADLDRIQLNVGLRTVEPLVVENDLANGLVGADLRLGGTAAKPALTGRIEIAEGAEFNLRERSYLVERGVITFNDDRDIRPIVDITARTKAPGHDITMRIEGDPAVKISTSFTSEPPLSQPDIIALLATGRTLSDARAAGIEVAKEQALSYLAGGIGGGVTQQAGKALGLSRLQIEPSLIASEAEPTARLTVGQEITSKLDFVYSMNLRNSSDQIWIGKYDFSRRFTAQALRQNDSSYRFQFQHDLSFGNRTTDGADTGPDDRKIGMVRFEHAGRFSDAELRKIAGLETGKPYDFFRIQRATQQLSERYAAADFLEARVSLKRSVHGSTVDIAFELQEGPRVIFNFEGWPVPDGIRQKVRAVWISGSMDLLRRQDSTELIQEEIARLGYLRPNIQTGIESESDTKRVRITVDAGVRYGETSIVFDGASSVSPAELLEFLKASGYADDIHSSRTDAAQAIRRFYARLGYIAADVGEPRYELDDTKHSARLVFPIAEGKLYRFDDVRFSGNRAFEDKVLLEKLSIRPEEPAERDRLIDARTALENLYRSEGYNDVSVQYTALPNPERSLLDVVFEITENRRQVLSNIRIEGNSATSENLIRTQTALKPGETITPEKLSRARNNLYATGAFRLVEIETVTPANDGLLDSTDVETALAVRVREVSPFEFRYGGFYDTERGVGGIGDFVSRNILGGARVAGIRTRYDSDLREVRAYFSQPTLRSLPLASLGAVFFRRESDKEFITDRNGVSANTEYRLGEKNVVTGGFRIEHVRTYEKILDPVFPFDVRIRLAPLTGSFTRDLRDDSLNATRGWFTSHTMEWAPAKLGSDLRYVKYFGQYFKYVPFGRRSVIPWAGGERQRLVYAFGGRVGLARAFGDQSVFRSERFFSGGGTTVRGFAENALGPVDFQGVPSGGEAVAIVNNEFRFPLYKFIDGVSFVDAGNVYRHVSDFRLSGLRTSAGAGIRVYTPYAMLRLDYGFNLRPRPLESRTKFFFSIGHAF